MIAGKADNTASVGSRGKHWSAALTQILAGARVQKVAPLLLLVTIGTFIPGGDVSGVVLAAAASYVFAVIVVGMHFNAVTDRELDRKKKPHLIVLTTSQPTVLRRLIVTELGCAAVALAVVALEMKHSLGLIFSMLVLGMLSVAYSYNFLVPSRAAECRGKIHWLSHFLTIWGSYVALWTIGFWIGTDTSSLGALGYWLVLAIALGLVDYAVFLHESANDWEEERHLGYRTLPALLGRERASYVGLLLLAGGVALAVGLIKDIPSFHARLALGVLLAAQGAGCLVAAWAARRRVTTETAERWVDIVFWSSRALPLLILIFLWGR